MDTGTEEASKALKGWSLRRRNECCISPCDRDVKDNEAKFSEMKKMCEVAKNSFYGEKEFTYTVPWVSTMT